MVKTIVSAGLLAGERMKIKKNVTEPADQQYKCIFRVHVIHGHS